MSIFQLFGELDMLIMRSFGDLEAALATERGKQLVKQLLLEENRAQLHEWYKPTPRRMNGGAREIKKKLESLLGEELGSGLLTALAQRGDIMDEQQWLECAAPHLMLELLRTRGPGSKRKLRLFACACCRAAWETMPSNEARLGVNVAERFADGLVDRFEVNRVRGVLSAHRLSQPPLSSRPTMALCALSRDNLLGDAVKQVAAFFVDCWQRSALGENPQRKPASEWKRTQAEGRLFVSSLLRCLFGNPFRPAAILPTWLDWNNGLVTRLAQAAYDERQLPSGHLDPARLAVLADALEEAGCEAVDILGHLRGAGPHYRGCHLLDVLLGKK